MRRSSYCASAAPNKRTHRSRLVELAGVAGDILVHREAVVRALWDRLANRCNHLDHLFVLEAVQAWVVHLLASHVCHWNIGHAGLAVIDFA